MAKVAPVLRRQIVIFAFYGGLALLALSPLPFRSTTHIPGQTMTDYFHFHWNYWWMREALASPELTVYRTDYVLFPAESTLALHTLAPVWYPVWAAAEPLLNSNAAFVVIYVLALALTGHTFYLLARQFGVAAPFALCGGVLLMLSPGQMNAVYMSTVHYLCFFWLPLNLLCWHQMTTHAGHRWRGWLWAVLLAVTLWGLILTDLQGPIYSGFLLIPLGVLTLVQAKTWRARLVLAGYGAASIAVALVLLWFVGPLRPILAFEPGALSPGDPATAFSISFPQGFFTRLPEYWRTHESVSYGYVVVPLFLAVSVIAAAAGRAGDRRWFWFVVSLPPLIFSAGATVMLFGAEFPLPYRWLHALFGGIFRQPVRLASVFYIPALIFIGLVISGWLRNRRGLTHAVTVALMLVVVVDVRMYQPLPVQLPAPAYDFYRDMAADGLDYVVLDVPTAAGSGEWIVGNDEALRTQYTALYHGKKTVNGLIARVNPERFLYMETEDPLLAWLGQRRFVEPDVVSKQLAEMIAEWPLGYIVVHTDLIRPNRAAVGEIIGYLNQHPELVCPYRVEGAAVAYRTTWHPSGCAPRTPAQTDDGTYHLDIGAADDQRFTGWGWHRTEEVGGSQVRWAGDRRQLVGGQGTWADDAAYVAALYVDLPVAATEVVVSAQAFHQPREVTLVVNGVPVGIQTVSLDGLQDVTYHVPEAALGDGTHIEFALQYDGVLSAEDAGLSADSRRIAIMVDTVAFVQ